MRSFATSAMKALQLQGDPGASRRSAAVATVAHA
jgi:hypothetical protein